MPCKLFFELPKAYFLLYKVGKGLLQEFLLSLSLSLSHTHTHTHSSLFSKIPTSKHIFFSSKHIKPFKSWLSKRKSQHSI